ncbi:MAG: M28 family peptidase [Planctomycetota bacterium]
MRRALALALLLAAPVVARAADAPPAPRAADAAPDVERLVATVRARAAPALAGVGTPADRETASTWLAAALRDAGARPLPGRDGYVVELPPQPSAGLPLGRNVVGWVPGAVPGEHVVLAAAYDGRPPTTTDTFLAADGRGTGLAAALEVTRLLAAGPAPRRGVMVALLDLSDHGEAGARALAAMPPPAGSRPVAAVVAERLGRSLGDAMPGALFVLGAERGTGLASLVEGMRVHAPLTLRALALDLHAEPTSSALPVAEAGWPVLLVTAGASKADGTPRAVADAVVPATLAARTAALLDLVRRVADAATAPTPVEAPTPRVEEATTLRALAADVLARAAALGLDARRVALVRALVAHLDEVLARGRVTPGERLTARLLALQVFAALQHRDR